MSNKEKEKQSILLVEDDTNFGDILKSYLEINEYEVDLAQDGVEGYSFYKKGSYDMVVLDVMMPKMDGFTLAEKIRDDNDNFPLIFLTAKTMKEDVLKGFKKGADDYLTKPFNSEELLMRIKAILKRYGQIKEEEPTEKEFNFSQFYFNYPLRNLIFKKGTEEEEEIQLSPIESDLLRLFVLNLNEVLPRSEALVKIWDEDTYFTARSMDVFITKLRKILKRDENLEIVNIRGNGFQLLVKDSI